MYDVQGLDAGILVRISDDREGRALGVKRQEEDTRHLAERLGVNVKRVYIENDISASAIAGEDRSEFEDFMADWAKGVWKVPLAYTTGRLTRDNIVAERVINTARQVGISPYYVASPWCDLNTAAGRRMYRSLAVNDTGEAEDIQERVTRKKLADAQEGKYPGGRRTYGIGKLLGINPKTGKEERDWTQLVDEEVTILKEIRDRLLAGDSQFTVVRDLNARGVLTSLGNLWTVGKIKRTVLCESYVIFDPDDPEKRGTRLHHGNKYRAVWPGIFTQVEHDMLVNYFKGNPFSWQQGKVIARRYLLTGLTYCGNCGGIMYGQGKTENGKYIRRYHCKKYNNRGEQVGCCKVFRIADPVEKLVSDAVLLRFDSPEVHAALAPADNKERVRELTQIIVQLQKRRQDLAREHAVTPYEDYGLMLTAIKEQAEAAQGELNSLRSAEAKKALVPIDSQLRKGWDAASLEWRANVIKLLVKKVIIHAGRSGGKKYEGRRFDPDLVTIIWHE